MATSNYIYDIVVRTQAQFKKLIESPDWLGAKSVLFVGGKKKDGSRKVFKWNDSIIVPLSIYNIEGINTAMIEINLSDSSVKSYGLGNESSHDASFAMSNLHIQYISTRTIQSFVINNLANLTNCTIQIEPHPDAPITSFQGCDNLINCTSVCITSNPSNAFCACDNLFNCTGTGTSNVFFSCNNLTNCIGSGSGTGAGFYSCTYLSNCISNRSGNRPGAVIFGFYGCDNLTNCEGTGGGTAGYGFKNCTLLANCAGTGTGAEYGYSFADCKYLNGCKQGDIPSSTAFLGGTNLCVDSATVKATP